MPLLLLFLLLLLLFLLLLLLLLLYLLEEMPLLLLLGDQVGAAAAHPLVTCVTHVTHVTHVYTCCACSTCARMVRMLPCNPKPYTVHLHPNRNLRPSGSGMPASSGSSLRSVAKVLVTVCLTATCTSDMRPRIGTTRKIAYGSTWLRV